MEESSHELKKSLADLTSAVIEASKVLELNKIEKVVDNLMEKNEERVTLTLPRVRIGGKLISLKEMQMRWVEREGGEREREREKEVEVVADFIVEREEESESEVEVVEEGVSVRDGESCCEESEEEEKESEEEKRRREKAVKRKQVMADFNECLRWKRRKEERNQMIKEEEQKEKKERLEKKIKKIELKKKLLKNNIKK